MAGRDGPPRERHNSPRKSRLLRYLRESQELNLDEMTSEFEDQLALIDADEGYPDSPPADFHLNLEATGRPEDMLVETTNVVILSNVPDPPHGIAAFASDTLKNCGIDETKVTVKPSKLKNILFFYDLDASSQKKLVLFIKKHHKGVSCKAIMGVSPHRFMDDTTEVILNILRKNQTEQMSYREIYERTPSAYLFLTEDFPYDTNRLVELNRSDFYGMRVRQMYQKLRLDRRHLMSLINVRSLAPLVHKMISAEPTPLDRNFLEVLHQNILDNALEYRRSAIYACGVHGDDLKKPLEHLVTCVPGVEVIWTADRKVIRKLELPERAVAEPAPRAQAATNAPPDAMRQEQEIVKSLSDILKRPSNLYMTLDDLEIALRRCSVRVDRTFSLRQFITERPKHFQILGERDYEVVTLSHRAQIKRVCNDLQKVLRPRKPKCISSAEIAIEFTRHWRSANELDRRFNVEDFGVCYLDDLLVTIPQHWGVHCSEYVSTDGKVVRRTKGNGEEDIPDFVLETPREMVNAWIPRHHQTEAQKKSLALLKQQVLNMFRGDPTADELIHYLTHQNRGHGPEHNRLIRLAYLRANHHQGVPHHGRDNPTLPFNFELEEKTFVPLYHRFCGEQVALVNFGVKDLFELFDSMQDTFEANGQGQERTIRLTSNARREILERRLIDVLRRAKRPMRFNELLQSYESEPTMKPYCNVGHLRTALEMSKLIETKSVYGNLYEAKPIFSCAGAVAAQPDVRHVLLIFMLSYAPLRVARIRDKFTERTGRPLDDSILSYLENAGAIRRVDVYDQLYDLHDICRVVRNLVYKMNELPNKIFIVESHPYLAPNQQSGREVSIASLLSFTGDFTFIKPSALLQIMNDFGICFEALNGLTFRLRPELMVWVPAPEEAEANQGRRGARGAHQGHRGVSQNRRGPRGAHQSHRGGNRSR